MDLKHFAKTVVGLVRKANEDYIGSSTNQETNGNGDIFVVCDGMGGHVGGATASKTAVECILQYFKNETHPNPILALEKAISFANEQIYLLSQNDPDLKGMGTTCTALLQKDDKVYIAHVGDSRIYLNTDNKLYRVTKDHSFIQKLVDAGQLEDSEMETHPRKNELTRALGISATVEVEVSENPLLVKNGDKFLMCSDGLCGLVNDHTISYVINKEAGNSAVDNLIQLAENAGGNDNISVYIIEVVSSPHLKTVFKDQTNKTENLSETQIFDVSSMKSDHKLFTILKAFKYYILSFLLIVTLSIYLFPGDSTQIAADIDGEVVTVVEGDMEEPKETLDEVTQRKKEELQAQKDRKEKLQAQKDRKEELQAQKAADIDGEDVTVVEGDMEESKETLDEEAQKDREKEINKDSIANQKNKLKQFFKTLKLKISLYEGSVNKQYNIFQKDIDLNKITKKIDNNTITDTIDYDRKWNQIEPVLKDDLETKKTKGTKLKDKFEAVINKNEAEKDNITEFIKNRLEELNESLKKTNVSSIEKAIENLETRKKELEQIIKSLSGKEFIILNDRYQWDKGGCGDEIDSKYSFDKKQYQYSKFDQDLNDKYIKEKEIIESDNRERKMEKIGTKDVISSNEDEVKYFVKKSILRKNKGQIFTNEEIKRLEECNNNPIEERYKVLKENN